MPMPIQLELATNTSNGHCVVFYTFPILRLSMTAMESQFGLEGCAFFLFFKNGQLMTMTMQYVQVERKKTFAIVNMYCLIVALCYYVWLPLLGHHLRLSPVPTTGSQVNSIKAQMLI